jgi:predicted nucleic acid-binding protein
MYLIDTDVLSAARKLSPSHRTAAWLAAQAPVLHVSTITAMEIERGIEQQRVVDPAFARVLEGWLDATLSAFDRRVLPVTIEIAQRWGRMQAQLGRKDFDVGIAATALEHGLQVVTRNVRHFDKTGVTVINPFASAP